MICPRLIPNVIKSGLADAYPPFVDPDISRDFVYVDDVTEAFVDAILNPAGPGPVLRRAAREYRNKIAKR